MKKFSRPVRRSYRTEYTINQRALPAIPCGLCGGGTENTESVFLKDTMVIRCLAGCSLEKMMVPADEILFRIIRG